MRNVLQLPSRQAEFGSQGFPSVEEVMPAHAHDVALYRDDAEFPVRRVAEFLLQGLSAGHGAVVLASRERAAEMLATLGASYPSVADAVASGRLVLVDTGEVVERLAADGADPDLVLRAAVASVIDDLVVRFGGARAYGELVDALCRLGDHEGAVALEKWWNGILATRNVPLLCAYSLSSFAERETGDAFRAVCAQHAEVLPAGDRSADPNRVIAELQQTERMLEKSESEARGRALGVARHLEQLQRVTSALSEAATHAQIAQVVVDELARIAHADHVFLAIPDGKDGRLRVLDQRGIDQVEAEEIPLVVGGRKVGVLGLGWRDPRELSPAERALLHDVARQIAMALERARYFEEADHERTTAQRERQRAESANRAKDEFLAMLGHELRNPLSPILTALQLMRLRGADAFLKERTIIERQVHHMTRLVDDLLDISRVTRGKVDLQRKSIDLADVVSEAVETASPILEQRGHKLTITLPPGGIVIDADAHRIAQVISNLLTNAAKYTPPGGRIEVHAHAEGGRARLSVRDNGHGIDPALFPHVFDIFVQGRQAIDRSQGGLGLGLAIARTLVELHGGTITVASDGVGRGSTFTVELPLAAGAAERSASGSPRPVVATVRCKVLVVDDNRDAAECLGEALRVLGYHVHVAHDGPAALEVARRFRPHVAVLDIGLPVMDGHELSRRLIALLADAPPRLIAVTGYGQESDRRESNAVGFDEHLVKPVDIDRVHQVIERLIAPSKTPPDRLS